MLALHLLHNALVSINTLMLQRVLGEASWATRLTVEDVRALTPLFYGHVSPYGNFLLDMQTRLDLELLLEAGQGLDLESLALGARPAVRAPRRRNAKAQQLALFDMTF